LSLLRSIFGRPSAAATAGAFLGKFSKKLISKRRISLRRRSRLIPSLPDRPLRPPAGTFVAVPKQLHLGSSNMTTILTIGQVAARLGCRASRVRGLILRGLIPEPPRIACYRVFTPEDLPAIAAALRRDRRARGVLA
jgi:hypothetical protein